MYTCSLIEKLPSRSDCGVATAGVDVWVSDVVGRIGRGVVCAKEQKV